MIPKYYIDIFQPGNVIVTETWQQLIQASPVQWSNQVKEEAEENLLFTDREW